MLEVDPVIFGRHERRDGRPGFREVMPTTMGYVEEDGSDIRLMRIRVYDAAGNLEHTYLQDSIGVRFVDMPDLEDDLLYLERLSSEDDL
ncbi:hypothetical protein IH980_04815 [Patescibacteria group bacterium]|nr:hypothetical protein [Patescibacteria group bacterium]